MWWLFAECQWLAVIDGAVWVDVGGSECQSEFDANLLGDAERGFGVGDDAVVVIRLMPLFGKGYQRNKFYEQPSCRDAESVTEGGGDAVIAVVIGAGTDVPAVATVV